MTNPQHSYSDAPEWKNGDPDARPPLEVIRDRVLEALNKGDPDTLDFALALCDQTDPTPTRKAVREAFAKVSTQSPDGLSPAVAQLKSLIRWECRPRPRAFADIDNAKPPALISATEQQGPLLSAGMVGILAGAGGTGKSKLATQLALSFARAEDGQEAKSIDGLWQVVGGPVLFASYEDSPAYSHSRLLAQITAHEIEADHALKRIHNLDLSAGWPLYGPPEGGTYAQRPGPLPGFALLQEAVEEIKPRLVIIDPALYAFVGEANAAGPVREFVGALASLAHKLAAAVLVLAHSTKGTRSNRQDDDPFDAGQISGSAAWHDAARAVLVLTREKDDPPLWRLAIAKANHGPSFILTYLRETGDRLGFVSAMKDGPKWQTKDGQPITAQEDAKFV